MYRYNQRSCRAACVSVSRRNSFISSYLTKIPRPAKVKKVFFLYVLCVMFALFLCPEINDSISLCLKVERKTVQHVYALLKKMIMERWKEIAELLKHEDILRNTKAQRIQWSQNGRMVSVSKQVLRAHVYKSPRKRHWPRIRWLDDMLKEIRKMNEKGYTERGWKPRLCPAVVLKKNV